MALSILRGILPEMLSIPVFPAHDTMPKLSDNTLFKRAIVTAVQDRESFADCYPRNSPEWTDARQQAEALHALTGKRLSSLNEDDWQLAFKAFVFAEQWEDGLADANRGSPYGGESQRAARLFREVRLRLWGRTQLEAALENTTTVSVTELVARGYVNRKSQG